VKPVQRLRSIVFFRPWIKEKLNQGVTLVVDRYAFSGVAFTSAKEVSVAWPPVRMSGVWTTDLPSSGVWVTSGTYLTPASFSL
jgi:hypothetical protein